jgi:clan AA aspartic protease (TIGR02281 family)
MLGGSLCHHCDGEVRSCLQAYDPRLRETAMKFLGLKAFLLSLLLASAAVAQSNLPPCPSDTLAEWSNCQGTRKIADGDYVGEWRGNRPNGQGTLTWPDGNKYAGQFHDGSISGQGTLTWANGDKYVGEFYGGKMDGMGTLVWSNGQKYVGTFSGGAMTGQGTMFAADGSVVSLATTTPSPVENQESSSGEEVLLKENRGIFVVPVEINGAITLDFAVDSGASTVTIPTNVYNTLVRTGTINDSDIVGQGTIVLADGSKSKLPVFRIRSLKVGDKTIKNVIAAVLPLGGQLLLGQSFLARFKSWSLDNKKHVLLLNTQ